MALTLIDVQAVAPQAWRNGGGTTRELITWPAHGPWQLRISRADIDADGAFSAFCGVTRWFAVLEGAGVALRFADRQRDIGVGDEALRFDGSDPPDCRLRAGPTRDLNLMATSGDSVMCSVVTGLAWEALWRMRGLYTSVAGHWQGPAANMALPAHTLLWDAEAVPGAWTFTPASTDPGRALWLGYTPSD